MKITCEIELDWVGEDGIDESVKHEIVRDVVRKLGNKVQKDLVTRSKEKLDEALEQVANGLCNRWLEEDISITDSWGDVVFKGTTEGMLRERFDKFWQTKVDQYGKTGYNANQTRMEWLMDQRIRKLGETFAEDLAKKVEEQVKSVLTDRLKLTLGANLVKSLGVENLIKQMRVGHE